MGTCLLSVASPFWGGGCGRQRGWLAEWTGGFEGTNDQDRGGPNSPYGRRGREQGGLGRRRGPEWKEKGARKVRGERERQVRDEEAGQAAGEGPGKEWTGFEINPVKLFP